MPKHTSTSDPTNGSPRGKTLSIGTVAMTPHLDPEVSRARLIAWIDRAKQECPDLRLLHFGETILGWFHKKGESKAYHARIAETVPGPTTDLVAARARELGLYVSFGLSERSGDKVYNTQALVDPRREIAAVHRKFWMRSPAFDSGGRALTLAEVDGARVALLICADARSLWLMRAIRRARADIVLASLADYGTDLRLNQMMGSFYDAWNIVANRFSEEPPLTWPGMITMTDRWARVRGHSVDREAIVYARVPVTGSCGVGRAIRRALVFIKLLGTAMTFIGSTVLKGIRKRLRRRSSAA